MIRPRAVGRPSGDRARGLALLSLPGLWVAAVLGLVYAVPGESSGCPPWSRPP